MENAYKLDKAHIHPDDMSKSTWVLVLAGTVRGSNAVAWVVQLPNGGEKNPLQTDQRSFCKRGLCS